MNDFLSKNRTQLMGYAILMVLVYHYGVVGYIISLVIIM